MPSEDWCSVEITAPAITSGTIAACWIFTARCQPSLSNSMPENSSASTVRYSITHQDTSNIAERGFHITIGCQMFQGLPRSYIRPTATRM